MTRPHARPMSTTRSRGPVTPGAPRSLSTGPRFLMALAGQGWDAPVTCRKRKPEIERLTVALEKVGILAALLDAARDAFELIISVSGNYADTDEGFSSALVYVLTAAADGRDAIVAAPSLPPRPLGSRPARSADPDRGRSVLDVVASLDSLSGLLGGRLASAASSARDPQDRAACLTGARYAREIHGLLAGASS
jgi:hypothetical protein